VAGDVNVASNFECISSGRSSSSPETPRTRELEVERRVRMAIPDNLLFDAPGQVDARSLTSGATGDEASLRFCDPNGEDMNADGIRDLVCHLDTRNAALGPSHDEGILKGTRAERPRRDRLRAHGPPRLDDPAGR
jgi:hypothetical protein